MGFFDLFIAFLVLWLWSLFIAGRPGSSAWARRWQWIVGLALAVAILSAARVPLHSSPLPDPAVATAEAQAPPPSRSASLQSSRMGAYAVLGGGALWLVGLTLQTFLWPIPEEDPPDDDG